MTGEIVIRRSLEDALRHLGAKVTVIRSDKEFNERKLHMYDYIVLDPWTWAAKGKLFLPDTFLYEIGAVAFLLAFCSRRD